MHVLTQPRNSSYWSKARVRVIPVALLAWTSIWLLWNHYHAASVQSTRVDRILDMPSEVAEDVKTPKAVSAEPSLVNDSRANDILVVYIYSEGSPGGKYGNGMHPENLQFFLKHALHPYADFVFVLNGNSSVTIPDYPNVKVIQTTNECYDFGRWGQVALDKDNLAKYRRFILMNASVRGPFMPTWSQDCWTDVLANRVNDRVKLVATTLNCKETFPHIQTMLMATDQLGLEALRPSLQCFTNFLDAVHQGEVAATRHIREAGYAIDVLMSEAHAEGDDVMNLVDTCTWMNPNDIHKGTSVHPFEVMFAKANQDVDQGQLERYTSWVQGRGYSSEKVCGLSHRSSNLDR